MSLQVNQSFKSIQRGSVDGVELKPFTVLTGQNGAGKSNLLESLHNGSVVDSTLGEVPPEQKRIFRLGELLAAAEGPAQGSSYKEPWANLFNNLLQWGQQVRTQPALSDNPIEAEKWGEQQVLNAKLLSRSAIDRMKAETSKTLFEMSVDDLKRHAPLIAGVKDPFASSIAEVFLSYAQRRTANDMAQWRQETKGQGTSLTDQEFEQRFGQPPWLLLDETLALVELPYTFVPPPEESEQINYEVTLLDASQQPIKPADLSSGERVLLAVAMSLFTGSSMSEAIELPKLLLLDEADASLHPSMVKSLLTVIEEIFVKQYGVRVVITTHSPTTVALAPSDSIFVMSRDSPRLKQATTDEALKLLTVGLSSLSVSVDNRRQVFVESEYDQEIYQDLFRIIKAKLATERSAEFIAAGKRGVGGGCDAVKRLVADLRTAGNATILGIVDRDNRTGVPAYIHHLSDRYSIENLLFDPLLLGSFLLREDIKSAVELGLPEGTRHFQLTQAQAQPLVDAVASLLGITGDSTACTYAGGFSVNVPNDFLETQGHELEALAIAAIPELNRFRTKLKQEIVNKSVADLPDFVPQSALDLFEQLLAE